jgi:hypothetical protein
MLAWGRVDEALNSAERTLASKTTSKLLRGRTLLNSADALTRKRALIHSVFLSSQRGRRGHIGSLVRFAEVG